MAGYTIGGEFGRTAIRQDRSGSRVVVAVDAGRRVEFAQSKGGARITDVTWPGGAPIVGGIVQLDERGNLPRITVNSAAGLTGLWVHFVDSAAPQDWYYYPLPGGGSGGGATRLTDLTDVAISGITDGSTVVWDSALGKLVPSPFTLAALADVDLSGGVSDGQALVRDSDLGKWVAGTVGGGSGDGPVLVGADGVALTQRPQLQVIGAALADDPTNGRSVLTINDPWVRTSPVTTDQTLNATALADVPGLLVNLDVGATYQYSAMIFYRVDQAVDLSLQVSVPSGATHLTGADGLNVGAASNTANRKTGGTGAALFNFGGLGAAAGDEWTWCSLTGRIQVPAAASTGAVKIQAAQMTAGTAGTIYAGSWITVAKDGDLT